jgi:hypothetical protein
METFKLEININLRADLPLDSYVEMDVLANDETEARQLAAQADEDGRNDVWLNPLHCTCTVIRKHNPARVLSITVK